MTEERLAKVFTLRKLDYDIDGVAFMTEIDHDVDGVTFMTEIDHMALTWLRHLSEQSDGLVHWALLLQCYNFSIPYRKGKSNATADALV